MSDIIQVLPDSVANQIAAGEVIQRPASVVKELVENSIDSGADSIKIIIKDSGKTLIRIIDNGCGMSETDARLSFERHATSKIKKAEDLFAINTMGFRGEALASIAAIAHVELKTKRIEDELGTFIEIQGSELIKQELVNCTGGCVFSIKNLFFNVPARRKFLKSNQTELRHIIDEAHRISLANPEISIQLTNNDIEIYNLPSTNLRQRIVNIFGKNINQNLISINTKTSIIKIEGFIGKPENARKTGGQQFFFVNKRFMKHPYFYSAIIKTYENLLPPGTKPLFFIYFTIDTQNIDVNIHPTKTEIKFTDEVAIWQIIQATLKESLGKFNIFPSIDFELDQSVNIPTLSKNTNFKQPEIEIDPNFNPFDENKKPVSSNFNFPSKKSAENWEKLYGGIENKSFEKRDLTDEEKDGGILSTNNNLSFFQYKSRYIITSVKSGLMFIDQKRAHERILFEQYERSVKTEKYCSQRTLFPKQIELNPSDTSLLIEIIADLNILGFDIVEFGKNTFVVNGVPPELNEELISATIDTLLEKYKNNTIDTKEEIRKQLAVTIAKAASLDYSKTLTIEEMQNLIDNLFACNNPNYTPDGKLIISILQNDEIEKKFK